MTQWVDLLIGIAAVIGAAAWIPQITKWLAKPKLHILSATSLYVSFTTSGVNAHWTISISTERQDALITKIELIITHQNGDKRSLIWAALEEEIFKITSVDISNPITYKKPSEVFAIKAITSSLIERTIFFYDYDFLMDGQNKISLAKEHYAYFKAQEEDAAELMIKTKEFKQSIEFFTKDMFWKEGDYEMKVRLTVKGKKSPSEQKFGFNLSKEDIANLRKNEEMFEPFARNVVLNDDLAVNWQYISANLKPLD